MQVQVHHQKLRKLKKQQKVSLLCQLLPSVSSWHTGPSPLEGAACIHSRASHLNFLTTHHFSLKALRHSTRSVLFQLATGMCLAIAAWTD